jgi:phosphatidylserine/phosphatidylglycerophosphate/cardiolipin synthase-like enzyme
MPTTNGLAGGGIGGGSRSSSPNRSGLGSAASWLSSHGIEVRYSPANPYLHAKVILSPTQGIVGSANLSEDGASVNRELDTVIPASLLPAAWAWGEALWGKGTPAD